MYAALDRTLLLIKSSTEPRWSWIRYRWHIKPNSWFPVWCSYHVGRGSCAGVTEYSGVTENPKGSCSGKNEKNSFVLFSPFICLELQPNSLPSPKKGHMKLPWWSAAKTPCTHSEGDLGLIHSQRNQIILLLKILPSWINNSFKKGMWHDSMSKLSSSVVTNLPSLDKYMKWQIKFYSVKTKQPKTLILPAENQTCFQKDMYMAQKGSFQEGYSNWVTVDMSEEKGGQEEKSEGALSWITLYTVTQYIVWLFILKNNIREG